MLKRFTLPLIVVLVALISIVGTGEATTFEIQVDDKQHIDVGEFVAYEFTADDPIDWITGNVQWGGRGQTHSPQFADRDVRVEIDTAAGFTVVYDTVPVSASQSFILFGPQPAGDYTVRVINDGSRDLKNVKIVFAAGAD